ncbi:conserved hypothetical protein [Paraburkholderia piptadeniae]|uniref:Uncharacterized protein n=1 Tax=Paraburkholderia piptadeniae TaxID=1701573 RepID=A0A1N7SWX8_9BURK|nr:conserved hypothetical protein [Paraburkholderia piptadeniae]
MTLCGSCIVSATDGEDAIALDAAHVATRLSDGPALDLAPSRDEDDGKVSTEAPTDARAPYGALVIIEPVSRGSHAAHADSLPSKGKHA